MSWEKKENRKKWMILAKESCKKAEFFGLSEKSDAKNQGVAKCCTFPYVELHLKK